MIYLKNIKMKGFKSFADKVTVDFEPSITGIIGPNGSGKSNISDAIKWVLGEQSAKALRGSKMKDVIFAGSDDRRPKQVAEVTLTLDNKDRELDIDYDQVKIGRKVTKDGKSDYLLNGQRCRLKDIQELLLDTGIGKEAYSIIGQGKVEAVLNEGSADRRRLFEEAAGITKHKQRKEESEEKLADTQQKLQRIEDIISEIKRQVGPLEEEAEKAKQYKEYSSELEEHEVDLLLNKYADLETDLDQKIATKQDLSYKLTKVKSKVNEYDLKIDKEEEKLDDLIEEIDDLQDKLYQKRNQKQKLGNKIDLAEQRENNLAQQKDRLKSEVKRLKREVSTLQDEIKKSEEKKKEVTKDLKSKKEVLNNQQDQLAEIKEKLQEKNQRREEIRNNKLANINEINQYQNKLSNLEQNIEYYTHEVEELQEEEEELNKELTAKQEEKEEYETELSQLQKKFEEQQQNLKQKKEANEELTTEFNDLKDKYDELKDKLSRKKSKLKTLKDLEKSYSGYYRGVKKVLKYAQNSDNLPGVCGVVAELIEVPKKYETAIEVALGSILQNIVVEDNKVGQKAIDYLKRNNAGRATFLPLDLIDPRSLRSNEQQALNVEGAINVAEKLVDYESQYEDAIKNILGRIIVAQDMDSAVQISKAANKRVKVVTLEGEIVRPGGSMTGGSRNKNSNLLGRSRQIEELSSEVEDLNEQEENIKNKGFAKRKELEKLREEIEKLDEEVRQLDLEQTSLDKDYQQADNEVKRLKKELNKKQNKINTLEEKQDELKEQQQQVKQELESLTTGEDDLEGLINKLEKEINALQANKEELGNKITDTKVEIASLEQEQQSLAQEYKNKKMALKNKQEKITKEENNITKVKEKTKEIESKKEELIAEKKELKDKIVEAKKELDSLKENRTEVKKKISQYQQESKESRERRDKLQEKSNQNEVKLTEIKVNLENIEEKLKQEYEIEVYDLIEEREEIDNYQEVEKIIKDLKKKMKELEPVNLGAIEEYENLSKRLEFLEEQHTDLIEGRNSLQEVISEIENEMKEEFLTTFKEVKEEFETIFVDLFEGGQAKLKLEDENDLLETGIEINAQPPGKNLQKLSLMSGGEKALTATALIFALLKVNPSPFYVLDELDAPLDDANVNRFANYLQELAARAQFIVITHRKGTMRAVNTLYGITMQNSGVSQIVSLKLDEVVNY
nr:chromosome segregation protein SMC [Halanaerobacter jeridensis]